MFLIHPNNINLIHKGRARASVSVMCLVLVKIYGNNPTKLFVGIIRNNEVRNNEFPLFSFSKYIYIYIYIYVCVCVCVCVCFAFVGLDNKLYIMHLKLPLFKLVLI